MSLDFKEIIMLIFAILIIILGVIWLIFRILLIPLCVVLVIILIKHFI